MKLLWILVALAGATSCAAPGEDRISTLDERRTIASLSHEEVGAWCLAHWAHADAVLGADWETRARCEFHAGREPGEEACQASLDACVPDAPQDERTICAEASPKPACDPHHTIGMLEACSVQQLEAVRATTCAAAPDRTQALREAVSEECVALLADPDCHFFAP